MSHVKKLASGKYQARYRGSDGRECEDNGHKPGSVQTFGRDLRAVIPTLKVTRPRADDDSRGYELDVAYRRGIGTVQVPNRGTNDVRQITA